MTEDEAIRARLDATTKADQKAVLARLDAVIAAEAKQARKAAPVASADDQAVRARLDAVSRRDAIARRQEIESQAKRQRISGKALVEKRWQSHMAKFQSAKLTRGTHEWVQEMKLLAADCLEFGVARSGSGMFERAMIERGTQHG